MNEEKLFRRHTTFMLMIIGSLLVIGAGSSSFSSLKKSAQATPEKLRANVVSLFPELEIVKLELLSENTIQVTLKNGYDTDITAVAASLGPRRFFYRDYIFAEIEPLQKLAPGATDIFLYDNPLLKGEKLLIRAVIFDDRMSLGDPRHVQDILDKRDGLKMQLSRIERYLQKLDKADSPSSVRSRLEEMRLVANSLPVKKEDGSPMSSGSGFESGLRFGRTYILKYISEMETELENERVEKFYDSYRQLQVVRYSVYENFRESFQRKERHIKGLLKRL